MEKYRPGWKVDNIKIPDKDVIPWIKILRENDFSDDELDMIMNHLNDEYAGQKLKKYVEANLEEYINEVSKKGVDITEQEKNNLRRSFLKKIRDKSVSEIEKNLKEAKEKKRSD